MSKFKDKIVIKVTRKHFKDSCYTDTRNCPLARASQDYFKKDLNDILVSPSRVYCFNNGILVNIYRYNKDIWEDYLMSYKTSLKYKLLGYYKIELTKQL